MSDFEWVSVRCLTFRKLLPLKHRDTHIDSWSQSTLSPLCVWLQLLDSTGVVSSLSGPVWKRPLSGHTGWRHRLLEKSHRPEDMLKETLGKSMECSLGEERGKDGGKEYTVCKRWEASVNHFDNIWSIHPGKKTEWMHKCVLV